MPSGTVVIGRDLTIRPGALLDAVTPGDPPGSPLVPATVVVRGDVLVGRGSVLLLGCSPGSACPTAVTHDRIGGNLTSHRALGVVVSETRIGGRVSLIGGGGGVVGGVGTGACLGTSTTPAPVPPLWAADPSLANGEGPGSPIPVYSDITDNVIGGDLTVIGLRSCWLGSIRNRIGGDATFLANRMGDPDAMEINDNGPIGGNMICFANVPAVQFGDAGAGNAPNIVGGFAAGQCGFKVRVPNPAPAGALEHISVRRSALKHRLGTHTETSSTVVSQTVVGPNTLVVLNNTDQLGGHGLTGAVTEISLVTVHHDGSVVFLARDTCTCTFDGKSGTVVIEAKGFSSASGATRGTFLLLNATGGLTGLAGYGRFSSAGEPNGVVRLDEHLKIT